MKCKVALVTGGLGGIGTAICQNLARQGMRVFAGYSRDHAMARAWQDTQKKLGFDIQIVYVDVADFASCGEMVKQVENEAGSIDILVNNAGITKDIPLYRMEPEHWQLVLKTNLDSMFNVTRHVINGMIARKFGRIINISSINGQRGQYGQANYSASKAGVHGFTKSLSQEVAKKGVTVNTISPGYIETSMIASLTEEVREKIISQIPVGRFGKPEEIAKTVAFLADDSSGFITGANLAVNGGQYLS